jgi:hypothetical protein
MHLEDAVGDARMLKMGVWSHLGWKSLLEDAICNASRLALGIWSVNRHESQTKRL